MRGPGHRKKIVGMLTALALWSIGAPARAETRSADDVGALAAGASSRWGNDEGRRTPPWPRRRGRGLRIAGSIVLGVGYTASVALAADTAHDGIREGWLGFVPLLGPAVAAGTGRDAVHAHAEEEAWANAEPEECTEDSSFCGLGTGLGIAIDTSMTEGLWVLGNAILTVAQIVGAVLLTAGHLLGARRPARSRSSWSSWPPLVAS